MKYSNKTRLVKRSDGPDMTTLAGCSGTPTSSSPPHSAALQNESLSGLSSELPIVEPGHSAFVARFMRKVFRSHGEFCASQPWEVIVSTFMFLVCVLTVFNDHLATKAKAMLIQDAHPNGQSSSQISGRSESTWMHTVVIITISSISILHIVYRFKKIHMLGSGKIWKIALSYVMLTSFLFALVIWSIGLNEMNNFHQAWFFIPLLTDMEKVTRLAQFALSSFHHMRIAENVSNGMCVLAPSFCLDTAGKVLLVTVGSLTGIRQLEIYSWYALVSVLVNFLVFLTFYPAMLSLVLDLMYTADGRPMWDVRHIIRTLPAEPSKSPGVHRVRVIATAGLLIIHLIHLQPFKVFIRLMSYTPFIADISRVINAHILPSFIKACLHALLPDIAELADDSAARDALPKSNVEWLWDNCERITIIMSICTLSVKFLLYEEIDEAKEFRHTYVDQLARKFSLFNKSEDDVESASDDDCDGAGCDEACEGNEADTNCNSAANDVPDLSCGERRCQPCVIGPGLLAKSKVQPANEEDCDDDGIIFKCDRRSVLVSSVECPRSSLHTRPDAVVSGQDRPSQVRRLTMTNTDEGISVTSRCMESECSVQPDAQSSTVVQSASTPTRLLNSTDVVALLRNRPEEVTDDEIVSLVRNKTIRLHMLEKELPNDRERAVTVRRQYIERVSKRQLSGLPHTNYDYDRVYGACCESVIGYATLPVGVVGPLLMNGRTVFVPMATTEGCLVASVNRGCTALRAATGGSGVTSILLGDNMTRGPVVKFPSLKSAESAIRWLESVDNFAAIKQQFDSTSRFARLLTIKSKCAGLYVYLRFQAKTGDAMGMNMLTKGTEQALAYICHRLPEMSVVSLSGNFCADKKNAAINWIDGRGKSVVAEACIPAAVVASVLKTTPRDLVKLNEAKNLVGSAIAGAVGGGFNAQAANVVSAIFIACGQDAAQNISSSQCLTQMELVFKDQASGTVEPDLHISVTMPSVEVGTVGGGTILEAQATCLGLMGVRGPHPTQPGSNAVELAQIVASAVLAGELSLMSALAAGHLVRSHLKHNRSSLNAATGASV